MFPLVPIAALLLAAVVDTPHAPLETPLDLALSRSAGEAFGAASRMNVANEVAAAVLQTDLVEARDTDLLAVLLAGATGKRDPRVVAGEMLHLAGGDLGVLTRGDILHAADLTPIGEARLLVIREIHRRAALRQALLDRPALTSAAAAASVLRPLLGDETEHLAALFLDTNLRLIRASKLSIGTAGYTLFDPREILTQALRCRAKAILIGHNHPSGNCQFSTDDHRATQALVQAARSVGIDVVDHVLLTRCGVASMATEGTLPR